MPDSAIAFVFPGQGSQKVGMLAAAHTQFESVRDTFSEAAEVLGYDVWQLICDGPQEALNLTATTQPVLLASSVALWRAWDEVGGPAPAVLAGHSLGEFSALVCAQVLQFAMPCRWCVPGVRRCKARCPWARAPWRRLSASTTRPSTQSVTG